MTGVRDLVDALISGDTLEIDSTFNNVMTSKISAAIDDYKIAVAHDMFNTNEQQDLVDDVIELSDEEVEAEEQSNEE